MNLARATIWASISYLVLPVSFITMGWLEMHSPDWNTNDSGAVQGFTFCALASISAFICVAIVFPLVASKQIEAFTSRKWIYTNIIFIMLVSYIASSVFCLFAGPSSITAALSEAALLSLLLTVIGLILLAPAMFVWLCIAKYTHN